LSDKLAPIHVPNRDDEERPPAAPERTQTLFFWAAATTIGQFVYFLYFQFLLSARLDAALAATASNGASLALLLVLIPMGVSQGAITGAAQWYLLRRYVKNIHWWIVASVLGWTTFYGLDFVDIAMVQHGARAVQSASNQDSAASALAFSLLAGLTIGLFQWLVLRRWGRPALLWIAVVIAAQVAGAIVPQLLSSLPVAPVMGWMANGLVQGLGMAYLLNVCWPNLLTRGQAGPA
jgi:hypothetical protein